MQKLFFATATALMASQAAMATSPVASNGPTTYGSGVSTSLEGAWVKPGFDRIDGAETVRKAGPVDATTCSDVAGYTKVGWTVFDRWGSFPIQRPDVDGEVRYCVAQQDMAGNLVRVAYDVVGE